MPKDRVTQAHQGYGFVEFMGEEDADYAIKIMNMIKLYGKPIRVNKVGCCLCDYVIKATDMMKYCKFMANCTWQTHRSTWKVSHSIYQHVS